MSHRLIATVLLAGIAVGAAACSSSTTPSTPASPKFTAALLPANEVPPITAPNVDATGSGTATVTLNVTKDSAGNITAATADFTVTLSGFPAGTTLTGAHIHNAPAGSTAGVLISSGIGTGEITLPNGSTTFTKTGITIPDPSVAQAIINTPTNYYFNVHTTVNGGGAARAQLLRAN